MLAVGAKGRGRADLRAVKAVHENPRPELHSQTLGGPGGGLPVDGEATQGDAQQAGQNREGGHPANRQECPRPQAARD